MNPNQTRITSSSQNLLFAILVSTTLTFSCQQKTEIPFPVNEYGHAFPETRPFQMPEPKSFEWQEIHPDSVTVSKVTFDIDKLLSIPFVLNNFKPLKKAIDVQPIEWDKLSEFPLDLDSISSIPIGVSYSILPEPKVSEINEVNASNTTSGLMSVPLDKGNVGLSTAGLVLDQHGLVWQANRKSLIKIVGDKFFNYPILSEIMPEQIIGLSQDMDHNFWISTRGKGLIKVNIENRIVTSFTLPSDMPDLIFDMEVDENGWVWFTNIRDAVYVLDPEAITLKKLAIQELEGNENTAISIKKDKNNNLWIGNRFDISIITSDRKSIKKIGIEEGWVEGAITGFFEDSNGNMWIGSPVIDGARMISLSNKSFSTLQNSHGLEIKGILYSEDHLNRIWIHDDNSSYVFDPLSNTLKKIQTNCKLLAGIIIGASLTDGQGNIWLGSTSTGMLRFDPLGPLPEIFDSNHGFDGNDFWGSVEDLEGRIWILTLNKIQIYDPVKNELKYLGSEEGLNKSTGGLRSIHKLRDHRILILSNTGLSLVNDQDKSITNITLKPLRLSQMANGSLDSSGNLWIGTGSGVIFIDLNDHSAKFLDQTAGLSFNTVSTILEGKDSKMFVTTYDKLNVVDPVENKIWHIGEEDGLASNDLLTIIETKNGDLWVPTIKGITVFDQDFKTFTNITSTNGLVSQDIYALVESEQNIYAGSSNGLYQIPKKQFQSSEIRENTFFEIYNYGKGFGYPVNDYNQNGGIFSKSGLALFGITPILAVNTQEPIPNPAASQVVITGLEIMDQKPSFKRISDMLTQVDLGDTLWNAEKTTFYFREGFIEENDYFSTHKITWDSLSPAFNLPIGLKLPYHQNALQFYFENTDLKNRNSILYSYILEGHDKTWSIPGPEAKTKNFFNLAPGNYTFKVVSKGFSGIWSEPASIHFTILPPWWLTWWGYLLFAFLFFGIVWAIVQVRSNMLKKENRILEEKVKHRTAQLEKSLTDLKSTQAQLIQSEKMASLGELTAGIAHEIQNPLNFVNNFSEVSSELLLEMEEELDKGNTKEVKVLSRDIRDNLQKIAHHGKRADSIVKGMLQHSRGTTGETKPTNINAMAEEYLRLSFQGFRARDKNFHADFRTEFDDNLPKINVVRQDIGRVMLNLINNAFYAGNEQRMKHLENGNGVFKPLVTVKTRNLGNLIEISVSDNGPGIPESVKSKIFQPFFTTKPAGQGTGLGLSLSYDIVKAHGGELMVESQNGLTGDESGTEFIIQLPIV